MSALGQLFGSKPKAGFYKLIDKSNLKDAQSPFSTRGEIMPKPISITINVEEIAAGRVFRTLDAMPGVVNISFHGSGPKANGSTRGRKKKQGGAQNLPCLILGALIDMNEPLSRSDLAPVATNAGKKASSIPDALSTLFKQQCVTRKGAGRSKLYTITAKGRKHYETACDVQAPGDE